MATEYLNNREFEKVISKFQQIKRDKTKYQLILQDINTTVEKTAKRAMFTKPESWQASEIKFVEVLDTFQQTQKELAFVFYKLAENIVAYAKFNLVDQDDAIQDCVMICFEKIDRFDPKKGKAFNYFTTCSLNTLRQLYRTSRNYNELKAKFLIHIEEKIGYKNIH